MLDSKKVIKINDSCIKQVQEILESKEDFFVKIEMIKTVLVLNQKDTDKAIRESSLITA